MARNNVVLHGRSPDGTPKPVQCDEQGNLLTARTGSEAQLNPPVIARYRARLSSPQAVSDTGSPAIVFDEELEDTASISNDGTTFTAPTGTTAVEINSHASWVSNSNSGLRQIYLTQNSGVPEQRPRGRVTDASASVDESTAFSSPRLPAAAGDTFQVLANQNSGASANLEATNNLTWVEVVFYG